MTQSLFASSSLSLLVVSEFRESYLALNAKNEQVVRAGMFFNVSLGFQGLKNEAAKDDKARSYAILLGDTVLVKADKPEICTNLSSKAYSEVGYSFKVLSSAFKPLLNRWSPRGFSPFSFRPLI